MDKVIRIMKSIIAQEPRIASSPAVKVGISEFSDYSITVYARVWCKQADYWDVMFDLNRTILTVFKDNSIMMPFPRTDVQLIGKGE
jgi:small conductance mechanosensitive channel